MTAKRTQVFLIAGAIILFVLLFTAPRTLSLKAGNAVKAEGAMPSSAETLDLYLGLAMKKVGAEEKTRLDKLVSARLFDSITAFWDKNKRPDIASHYAEQKALSSNKAADWFGAGNRYYYSVQFCQDKSEVPVLYQCAMRCFNKGLAIEPANTDARIMLASCMVEGSSDPMQGITRLREIEKTDSNNVKLQLSFAFFSVKSGQTNKAIERFNRVLRIDSSYIAAYLHLADAYEKQGDTENTIRMLEMYSSRTNDVTARLEINRYIEQLKTNKQ